MGRAPAQGASSACTSASTGRAPSITQVTQVPEASAGRPDSSISEGFSTSRSPVSSISNTPISLVAPKRFFAARRMRYVMCRSPSKYSTQSTMCSSTLGPAMEPSLFTWPMTNTVTPCPFASCISAMVQSFTCPTPPAGESSSSLYSVWIESTMRMSGCSSATHSSTSPSRVSDNTNRFSLSTCSRSARSFSCRVDSSPDTYSTLANCPSCWQICSIRVDLPMPGAPPTSTSEPFTAPPPSTRSSSPIPVEKRISSSVCISVMRDTFTGVLGRDIFPLLAGRSAACSTMEFHAPHTVQRPDHLGLSLPHSVQKNTVLAFIFHPSFVQYWQKPAAMAAAMCS